MANMGLAPPLADPRTIFKRKFRYRLKIADIIGDEGLPALPPNKAARPKLQFKELEVQHLNETIHFPGKPEWQTFNVQLYDVNCYYECRINPGPPQTFESVPVCKPNPVWDWVKTLYDPKNDADYRFVINDAADEKKNLKRTATLEILDGCGSCVEKWVYENAWPTAWDFQELDMNNSELLFIDLTLRYDRAYIETCTQAATAGGGVTNPLQNPNFFPQPIPQANPNGFPLPANPIPIP